MAVHAVFINARALFGARLDRLLREDFSEVYRLGSELWLIDSAREADQVAATIRGHLAPGDKLFVAGLTRDVVPDLSDAAQRWLRAPERTWRRAPSRSEAASLFALAA